MALCAPPPLDMIISGQVDGLLSSVTETLLPGPPPPPFVSCVAMHDSVQIELSAQPRKVTVLYHHMQARWATLRAAVHALPGCESASLEDIEVMAVLCPEVVFLQDTNRWIQAVCSHAGDSGQGLGYR